MEDFIKELHLKDFLKDFEQDQVEEIIDIVVLLYSAL
jgi:hypothetical protein